VPKEDLHSVSPPIGIYLF